MNRLKEKLENNRKRLEDLERKIRNLEEEKKRLERKISLQEIELRKVDIISLLFDEGTHDKEVKSE